MTVISIPNWGTHIRISELRDFFYLLETPRMKIENQALNSFARTVCAVLQKSQNGTARAS